MRITKYYDGACVNGMSKFVDVGQSKCDETNGFKDGMFAEWKHKSNLTFSPPPDSSKNAGRKYDLVKQFDDFRLHKEVFAEAAGELIDSGKCTAADFKEMGGWMKSIDQKNKSVYFTYCGGMRSSNKIYLDAASGQTWR